MDNRLEVTLFGGISFLLDGQPVKSLPTRVAQALVIYLLHKKVPVEREQLIDMFYQASTPKQAAANFRSVLSRMRKELAPFLIITNRTVSINPDADIWIDSIDFEKQAHSDSWAKALELYQGDFLAGFFLRDAPEFENWALVERERFRLMAIEGLQNQIGKYQRQGEFWEGLQAVNRLLAIDPFIEEIQREKMLLLTRTGQRNAALQHYESVALLFENELGIALSPETTALHERIVGLKVPPASNITAAYDKFVGRQSEVNALLKLLAEPERRLITLFGIGGTGKTRLALETARAILANNSGLFLDGIQEVSMVGVKAAAFPNTVALHILQTLGMAGGPQSPSDQLIGALKNREMLLILDNFEHLVENNGRFISQLLTEAPKLKLIITSRERLNLVEETVFDLEGLPFSKEATLDSDAAQLFISHAQRHRFTFSPANSDTPAIANMCQLLEGSPLGIELAAGSIRYATCDEIVAQIEKNLGMLTSRLQNVPRRHRSLRAVFMHSWNLLPDNLRPIYANLAIFPASFDADAASAIANATQSDLEIFVDKAMLKVGNGRYTIHPILREFATEQIAVEQTTQLRHSHATYFANFIAERTKTDHRPTYLKDLPDLLTAYDDLIPAWNWTIAQLVKNGTEVAWDWVEKMRRPLIRLHFQHNWFFAAKELFGKTRQQLEDANWHLESAPATHRLLHAQITVTECNCTRILGDVVAAIEPTERAIPLLREHVALDDLFDAYNLLTGCNMQLREFEKVPDQLNELEAIASETQLPKLFGVYYVSKSYYEDYMGNTEASLAFAEKGLAAFQALEDTYYEAIVLDGIARAVENVKSG